MKKFLSPDVNVDIPVKAFAAAEHLATKAPRKQRAKETTKRAPRPLRAFRYRGEQFMFINHEDLTLVCTVNKQTKKPEPVIEVPNEKAKLAVRALTKILQAETILDSLKR